MGHYWLAVARSRLLQLLHDPIQQEVQAHQAGSAHTYILYMRRTHTPFKVDSQDYLHSCDQKSVERGFG